MGKTGVRTREAAAPPSSGSSRLPPGFQTRAFSGLNTKAELEWGRRNGLTKSLAFSHHLAEVFPRALYARHPEFFPLENGKRIEPRPTGPVFWNPDIARPDVAIHAAAAARAFFRAHPEEPSFALGVNDALIWGESPELLELATPTKWFRGRPDYSNVVVTFMNRAAAELERTHPQKYLGALAYYWAENAPDVPLHPQVIPFLTADRSQGYDEAFRREELQLQERWGAMQENWETSKIGKAGNPAGGGEAGKPEGRPTSAVGRPMPVSGESSPVKNERRLGMYDYLFGGGFLIPRVQTRLLAENLQHAHRSGFTDYYAEVYPNWGLDGPMPWLTAQLLQDPEQRVDVLLDEFYRRYFREAAEPMRRFFGRCEAQWMQQEGPSYWLKHYRNDSQAGLFPPPVRAELRHELDRAQSAAANLRVRERVRWVAESFAVTERFCAMREAATALMTRALRHDLRGIGGAAAIADYLSLRRDFIATARRVTSERPLAFHPINFDDFLRNDPSFTATAVWLADARKEKGTAFEVPSESVKESAQRWSAWSPTRLGTFALISSARGQAAPPRAALLPLTPAPPSPAKSELPANESERILHGLADPGSDAALAGFAPREFVSRREWEPNGSLEGALRPERRIAGLTYTIGLPEPWQSRVEPVEHHAGAVVAAAARTGAQGLRISGAENDTVFHWLPATEGKLYLASVTARGRVSLSNAVTLTLGWLDAAQRPVGTVVVARLPEGEWPDWVELRQGGWAPPQAAWMGIGVRVQHQSPGDWVEFDDFSLQEVAGAVAPAKR